MAINGVAINGVAMNQVLAFLSVGLVAILLGCEPDATFEDSPSQQEVENVSTEMKQGRTETDSNAAHSGSEGATAASPAGTSVLADYLPLGTGDQWQYEVVARRSGQVRTASATKQVAGTRSIGGRDYYRITTGVEPEGVLGPAPPPQFYRVAKDGVYAAVQGAAGKELLVLPADPKSTRTWKGDALPAIKDLSGVASTGETCELGKQKYSDCVKVSLKMTVLVPRTFRSPLEVPVQIDRWFARGVGLVREVRDDGTSHVDSKLTAYKAGGESKP